jgi:hypothetical protein
MSRPTYVRYQSPVPDRRGRRIGIFGLVNMLGQRGLLTEDEEHFRRTTNAWYDATYVNPSDVDPSVYDFEVNPHAAAWFVSTAEHLLEPVPGYLEILAAHNLPCERYESADPGRVLYKDQHQVAVVPHETAAQDPTTIMWFPPIPDPV